LSCKLSTERNVSGSYTLHRWATKRQQQTAKGSSKFSVEDGVDNRVEEAVEIAEPDAKRKQNRFDVTDRIAGVGVVANADSVDDVKCEERKPTEKKDTWKSIIKLSAIVTKRLVR
jgi:hypothetical protein